MTRKDYKKLAYLLHTSQDVFGSQAKMRRFVHDVCNLLEQDNAAFRRTLFIEAVYSSTYWQAPLQQRTILGE